MIRVGIVGAGDFGAQHAQALAQLDTVCLTAAARTDGAALQAFTQRYGGSGYTDYRCLLADESLDVVVIATPHHQHTPIALAAAQAGKHILLEKPMAPTLAECDALLAAVQQTGVKLMVGHINHFVPAYATAKALLDSGELGEIVCAHSTMSKSWMTANRRAWHLDRKTGGGIWLTIGVHVIDQLCWLIGAPVTQVSAALQTRFHLQHADDIGVAFLRFADETTATATAIGYQTGVFSFITELTCTKGMLRIDHRHGVSIGRGEVWQAVPGSECENWMAVALNNQWKAFIAALEQAGEMPVSGSYARQIMAVVFAAETSSQQQREIRIP